MAVRKKKSTRSTAKRSASKVARKKLESRDAYRDAGVDRDEADRFVEKLSLLTLGKKKPDPGVRSRIGGYASLYEWGGGDLIAATTDGVGTKLKLAFELEEHSSVGIDLVAMSVNDLICVGAKPLFFLDYLATGKLKKDDALQVIQGIVEGCAQAGCSLVGGETAEMPGFYSAGEYDLAGFAVGRVNERELLPRSELRAGDQLIGIASSGCHSNGYSLLRKLLPKSGRERKQRAWELLTPTRIYVKSLLPLVQEHKFKALAHITGSGFLNVPRMGEKWSYEIELPPLSERAPIFEWVYAASKLSLIERAQTFNLGIGMVAAVSPDQVVPVLQRLKKSGETAWLIGEVKAPGRGGPSVTVREAGESCVLK